MILARLFVNHISRQPSWQGKNSQTLSVRKVQLRNRIIIPLLIIVVMAGFAHPATAQSEKLGYLRIRAQYPIQVPRSYTFQVNVTVQYAFREYYEIQAAIYEGPRGTLGSTLWQGAAERLIDVGEKTYNVQLKSPDQEGQWIITGYAFYHIASGSGYFSDKERGPGFVEMQIKVADNAKLTLRTPHGNMPISVDGTAFTTDKDGMLVREVKVLADHSFAAPKDASMAEGWRAEFRSWNGTDQQNPKTVKVTKDMLLTVDYQDQFLLDVVSDTGHGVGAGWYRAGAIANFSVPVFVPQEGLGGLVGIRWRFTGWSGDVTSRTNSESVVMSHPYRVVANWTVDYQQSYYFAIGASLLVAAALGAFVVRRVTAKRPLAEEEAEPLARTLCIHCGAEIDPDAKFCSKCGESQFSSE